MTAVTFVEPLPQERPTTDALPRHEPGDVFQSVYLNDFALLTHPRDTPLLPPPTPPGPGLHCCDLPDTRLLGGGAGAPCHSGLRGASPRTRFEATPPPVAEWCKSLLCCRPPPSPPSFPPFLVARGTRCSPVSHPVRDAKGP